MHTVFLNSEINGLLKINGTTCHDMCGKEIKLCLGSYFVIEFYPYYSEYESFCEKVFLSSPLAENYKIILWTDCIISIKVTPKRKRIVRPLVAISQVFYEENTYTLCDDGSCFLLFESSQAMNIIPINFDIISARLSIENISGITCLRLDGQGKNEKYFGLYRMSYPYEPLYEGIGESFSLEEQILKREKCCRVMSHARIENSYQLGYGGCQLIKTELLDYEREYQKNMQNVLKIYAFLEGVNLGIEELCEAFLSPELREDFTIDLAINYFGEFVEIEKSPLQKSENIIALVYKGEGNICSFVHYQFDFQNGLISNFSKL